MEITQELLKDNVQKRMNNQKAMLGELYQNEEFSKICEKYGTTLVDLSNSLISDVFASSSIDLKTLNTPEVFGIIDRFLEDISKKMSIHPSDAVLLLAKVFSDMMVQVIAVIQLEEENKENESEVK